MRKILLWTLIGGGVYYNIEGLWRLAFGNGWAHSSMIFVGALFGLLWVLLAPFGVWLEDKLNLLWNDRYGVSYDEMYDYTLFQAYRELLFG